MTDGRYFPTDAESKILSKYISTYFNYPERSNNRASVVQEAVRDLSAYNQHWTTRTVRLWFNNNKKLLSNNQYVAVPVRAETGKKTYLPPRPATAIPQKPLLQFPEIPRATNIQSIQTQIPTIPPRPETAANLLREEYNRLANEKSLEALESIDENTRDILARYNIQSWNEFVLSQDAYSHTPVQNLEMTDPFELIKFNTIECCYLSQEMPPAIVTFRDEKTQQLVFGNNAITLNFTAPASAMTFDKESRSFWISSGRRICAYNEQLEKIRDVRTNSRISHRSGLAFGNKTLFSASGSSVHVYSAHNNDYLVNYTMNGSDDWTHSFRTELNHITCIEEYYDNVLIASSEHHSIHLYSPMGDNIAIFTDHTAGIADMKVLDDNVFITGSMDQTSRVWDKRMNESASLVRHNGIITAVNGIGETMVTGGTDGVVRLWDIRKSCHFFTGKCEGVPTAVCFNYHTKLLTTAISEREADYYMDMGCFGDNAIIDGATTDAIITFKQ